METLAFWHPSEDDYITSSFFDWGTVAAGSSDDKMFRIRNESTVYDAVGVVVSLHPLEAPATPGAQYQHYLSLDGNVFTATVSVDIAAATLSPLLWLRRVTPSTATTGGPFGFEIRATATTWS